MKNLVSQRQNKTEETKIKKVKRTYLDACPGWDTFNIHKKHVIVCYKMAIFLQY